MATIALYANSIIQMPGLLKGVEQAVFDYKMGLYVLHNSARAINKSVCDLDDVMDMISASTQIQEKKYTSIQTLDKNIEQFVSDSANIDRKVADLINQRKDEFYESYSYLKPKYEESSWKKFCDNLKTASQWCKENQGKIAALFLLLHRPLIKVTEFMSSIPIEAKIIQALPDILKDIQEFNLSNEDENVALSSKYFSWYKGHLVIRLNGAGGRPFSLGVLFIGPYEQLDDPNYTSQDYQDSINRLRHEYGHTVQLKELGLTTYIWGIAIPSAMNGDVKEYYDQLWEVTADLFGGVVLVHTPGTEQAGLDYLEDLKRRRDSFRNLLSQIPLPPLPISPLYFKNRIRFFGDRRHK